VKGYNIRFGVYRTTSLDITTYQNIEKDTKRYEEIIKMQRVEASETFLTVMSLSNQKFIYFRGVLY